VLDSADCGLSVIATVLYMSHEIDHREDLGRGLPLMLLYTG
jgi:hypothetical protein